MISIKAFNPDEFDAKVKTFAQSIANKIANSEVLLIPNSDMRYIVSYVVSVNNGSSSQHTLLGLDYEGFVEMSNILGNL